jgi:endonuclease-3
MPGGKKMKTGPEKAPGWAAIFKKLETWRKNFLAAGSPDTAVTEIAAGRSEGVPEAPPHDTPPDKGWAVLVSTILSLRTKDEVTRSTSKALLERAGGPAELLRLGEKETARLAYPAGFYRTKAANLQKIAAILLEQYGGNVPSDMDALLALPGVGRKTANLVLVEAFDKYGICVDIHVHRISNRSGWVETDTPEKTEMRLREILPRSYWKRINGLLVLYGQNICRPVSPFCSRCVITEHCSRRGVEKSR